LLWKRVGLIIRTLEASCDSVVIVIEFACAGPARSLLDAMSEYKPGDFRQVST
jgi:hypothetical protein